MSAVASQPANRSLGQLASRGLALLLRAARAVLLCALTYALILAFYGLCKWEPFFTAQPLTMTALDQAIPFLPWTVWVYSTVSSTTALTYFLITDRARTKRLALTLLTASALCAIVFALFPTTYPRELYPLPDATNQGWFFARTLVELADLRASDDPANCLPSLHVALATSLALTLAERGDAAGAAAARPFGAASSPARTPTWVRVLAPIWAICVSLSTLTVKQHYVVDVPAGALVGLLAHALCAYAARAGRPVWSTSAASPLALEAEADRAAVATLLKKVEAHQWSLDDLDLPTPNRPFDAPMVRLLNHVIYIEEIAAGNFRLLGAAATDPELKRLYTLFEDEEHRHAEGLRRLLLAGGGWIEKPGLGNALILDQQRHLDPRSDADAILVTVSNPVFETFLDAGTVPFLREHRDLKSPAFDEFVARITRDEAAHLGLNWLLTRKMARERSSFRHLLNPAIYRGMLAVPFMSLDVYALAQRLGYDFQTLIPSFKKLWKLHRKFPELRRFPMWRMFRLFVLCGIVATWVALFLVRAKILFVRFWTTFSRATDYLAWALFGDDLLKAHALPPATRARPTLTPAPSSLSASASRSGS